LCAGHADALTKTKGGAVAVRMTCTSLKTAIERPLNLRLVRLNISLEAAHMISENDEHGPEFDRLIERWKERGHKNSTGSNPKGLIGGVR